MKKAVKYQVSVHTDRSTKTGASQKDLITKRHFSGTVIFLIYFKYTFLIRNLIAASFLDEMCVGFFLRVNFLDNLEVLLQE